MMKAPVALLLLGLAPLTEAYTFPRLKPANLPLYDEALPCAYASRLMYAVSDIISNARATDEKARAESESAGDGTEEAAYGLTLPEGFPIDAEGLKKFRDHVIDFRGTNGNNGLSFSQIVAFLEANEETVVSKKLLDHELDQFDKLDWEIFGALKEFNEGENDRIFLERFNVLDEKKSFVYGVVKDTARKQIIVSFRGSQSPFEDSRDWPTNLNARMTKLRTPKLIRDKMDGMLNENILVHEGYYNYLFNNDFEDGDQKFDRIIDTIKDLLDGDNDYSVCITGHSLGGALASLFAVKLSGMDGEWLPRPVTCISYASPRFGASGLRVAHEQLERDGLLRHLRINNDKDIVPTGLAVSLFSKQTKRQALKHVGVNLRLRDGGFDVLHTSKLAGARRLKNALRNTIFKPAWKFNTYHMMPEHVKRMKASEEELRGMKIDELYRDVSVVSEDFVAASTVAE